jgi:hypothetical protein
MLICSRNLNRNIIIIGFIKHNCELLVYSIVVKNVVSSIDFVLYKIIDIIAG